MNTETGKDVAKVDTSNPQEAEFKGNAIRFIPSNLEITLRHKLVVDAGVAVGIEKGCMFDSLSGTWSFRK